MPRVPIILFKPCRRRTPSRPFTRSETRQAASKSLRRHRRSSIEYTRLLTRCRGARCRRVPSSAMRRGRPGTGERERRPSRNRRKRTAAIQEQANEQGGHPRQRQLSQIDPIQALFDEHDADVAPDLGVDQAHDARDLRRPQQVDLQPPALRLDLGGDAQPVLRTEQADRDARRRVELVLNDVSGATALRRTRGIRIAGPGSRGRPELLQVGEPRRRRGGRCRQSGPSASTVYLRRRRPSIR